MAVPFTDLDTAVKEEYLPHLIDQVFIANALLAKLMAKSKVEIKGGRKIRQPVLYGKSAFGSYVGADTFDIGFKPKKTMAEWSWRYVWSNVTITGTDMAETDSNNEIIDHLDSEMQVASMTVNDGLGTMFFSDGTGNGSKDFEGLLNAIDHVNYTTYGGISRYTQNTWWNAGYLSSTGGALTLDRINTAIGQCTVGDKKPDFAFTTQALYDKIWARLQPSQRGSLDKADYGNVGFTGFKFNNHMDIVVDNHCPSGYFWLLNTDFIKLMINKNKNFQWTEPKTPTNADMYIRQLLLGGNLICLAPRFQGLMTGLS